MKRVSLLLLLVTSTCFVHSQVLTRGTNQPSVAAEDLKKLVETGIDPRKYITVIYKKRPNEATTKTLAVWRWDEYAQHQKYKVLDRGGMVEIYFDKDKLANDQAFKGNISLEANIKSKGGDRKIEVLPYSLVGVQSQEFGIKSLSPALTAQLLYNTILSIKKDILHPERSNAFETYAETGAINPPGIPAILAELQNTAYANKRIRDTTIRNSAELDNLRDYLLTNPYYPTDLKSSIDRVLRSLTDSTGNARYSQLATDLERLKKDADDYNNNSAASSLKTAYNDYNSALIQLKAIIAYLNSFDKAGEDAVGVFLQLIGKDKVKYRELLQSLTDDYKKFSEIATLDEKVVKDKIKAKEYNTIVDRIRTALFELSSITGSEFYKLVKLEVGPLSLPQNNFLRYIAYKDTTSALEYEYLKKLKSDEGKLSTVLTKLSILSGTYLYSLLTYASIDLLKNDAKEGDRLYISVKWWNFRDNLNQKDSGNVKIDEISLPIGVYDIQKTGWSTDVSESFYLIERLNEPGINTVTNLSPSNFKGAAGVSLMRTYNYCEYCSGKKVDRFFNFLQPSIGLNLSYVDFYTTKDLELGLGIQLGLFSNSIYLGYGLNLNSIRKGENNGTYFMLGLSFVNLGQKIKSLTGGNQ